MSAVPSANAYADGVHLARAASYAFDAQRMLIAAAIHAEDGGLDMEGAAPFLEGVGQLAMELLAAANACGHEETHRHARRARGLRESAA
jgi:hypothetical protein